MPSKTKFAKKSFLLSLCLYLPFPVLIARPLSVWTNSFLEISFRKQTTRFGLMKLCHCPQYIKVLSFRKRLKYIPVIAAHDRSNRLGTLFDSRLLPHHFEWAKLLNMAHNTPDDTPADTPIDTPVAPDFPGQTYRDRSSSPNSDDSDSGPKSKSNFLHTPNIIKLTDDRTYSQ